MAKRGGNGDVPAGPTPSGLGRLFKKIHDAGKTERAIADTAKGRRIKAKQAKEEKKKDKG